MGQQTGMIKSQPIDALLLCPSSGQGVTTELVTGYQAEGSVRDLVLDRQRLN